MTPSLAHLAPKLAALLLVAATGGCASSLAVIKQATPNPLAGKRTFTVEPVAFETWEKGSAWSATESAWLAKSADDPDAQAKKQSDIAHTKEAIGKMLSEALQSQGKSSGWKIGEGGDFIIKPRITEFDPGFYAVMAQGPCSIRMRLIIADKQGAPVDEVEVVAGHSDAEFRMTGRCRLAAEKAASEVAEYLAERTR